MEFFQNFFTINVLFELLTLAAKVEKKTKTVQTFEEKFEQFNLTKRPLNLYILENGKHVVVLNKTLCASSNESLIDYRIGKPPFLIKTRGSILLLHNNTKNGEPYS